MNIFCFASALMQYVMYLFISLGFIGRQGIAFMTGFIISIILWAIREGLSIKEILMGILGVYILYYFLEIICKATNTFGKKIEEEKKEGPVPYSIIIKYTSLILISSLIYNGDKLKFAIDSFKKIFTEMITNIFRGVGVYLVYKVQSVIFYGVLWILTLGYYQHFFCKENYEQFACPKDFLNFENVKNIPYILRAIYSLVFYVYIVWYIIIVTGSYVKLPNFNNLNIAKFK